MAYATSVSSRRQDYLAISTPTQWWIVGCLALLSTLSYIDKNIIMLMIRPIELDLKLSATEVTFAVGSAFALANLLVNIPAGWAADRLDRRVIVAAAVLLWSVMAVLCGFVTTFATLFIVRGGVGFAEGMLPPASYSLIRNAISPSRLARAFSIFAMSALVGSGVAFLAGGALIKFVLSHNFSHFPILAGRPPWAIAIGLVGLMGLPLSFLLLTFREPLRSADAAVEAAIPGTAEVWRILIANRRIFILLAIFSVAHAMLTNSVSLWLAPLLNARFGLTPMQIGFPVGALLLVAGPLGLFGAGATIDFLDSRRMSGPSIVAVAASAVLLVTAPLLPFAPNLATFWIVLGVMLLVSTTYLVVTSTLVAQFTPAALTGRIIALFLLVQGGLGVGVAPTLTALAEEHVFSKSETPIATAMSGAHATYAVIALTASIFLLAANKIPRTLPVSSIEVAKSSICG